MGMAQACMKTVMIIMIPRHLLARLREEGVEASEGLLAIWVRLAVLALLLAA